MAGMKIVNNFTDGWMRFWHTFSLSGMTVVGFFVALMTFETVGDVFEYLVMKLWNNLW